MVKVNRPTSAEPAEIHLTVQAETDIVAARTRGRAFARLMGLSSAEATVVATVVSELARSLQRQAGGELIVAAVDDARRYGIAIRWRDRAQGIEEPVPPAVERLLDWPMVGWIRQAMDEFKLVAEAGSGTIVMVRKGRGRALSGRTRAEAVID